MLEASLRQESKEPTRVSRRLLLRTAGGARTAQQEPQACYGMQVKLVDGTSRHCRRQLIPHPQHINPLELVIEIRRDPHLLRRIQLLAR
jgi:hypothetical protein